jgi:kinesin family protein 6/9
MSGISHRVKVVVRTRPTDRFAHEHIHFEGTSDKTVSVRVGKNEDQLRGFINNKQEGWSFPVDVILHNASQELVYETCGQGLVVELMRGYNGTLLTYGETGAGKTYTMCGPPGNYQARGVIPRAIAQVFSEVRGCKENSYNIHVSYLEIYNDLIFDLLATLPVDSGSDCSTPDQPKPLNIAEV